jgi:hypothetical protein
MRVFRRGRILDPTTDALFPEVVGNGITLARTATDNYIRPRTPNVDCTNTNHTPPIARYDDGTQTNRWVSVPSKSLPVVVNELGWLFSTNQAIRTNYNIPTSITQYSARVAIPEPYFPVGVIPRQWCLDIVGGDESSGGSGGGDTTERHGKTISGLGIRWGNLFWGVGHYQINCCPSLVEQSACLILAVGTTVDYYFPMWGAVSQVDLTIQRVSATQARVIATSSAGTFQLDITHTLNYTHPYQAEYYLKQVSQGCTPPPPITPYTLKRMQSPSIQYTYELPLDTQQLATPIYLQIKSLPDEFVEPTIDVLFSAGVFTDDVVEFVSIPFQYNSNTNLWHATQPIVLDSIISASVAITANCILERVSVLMGGAELHHVPAPHQVEWMAVVPVEMEQTGIPSGIIPAGYDVLGTSDYARVLSDGTIAVLPAQHARVITIHLRERLR